MRARAAGKAATTEIDIEKIAVGPNPPHEINVIVEVPLRSDPIKYEFDKSAGAIVVDRILYTTMFYPVTTASSAHAGRGR
jgi:inorganic pyrophosphatase